MSQYGGVLSIAANVEALAKKGYLKDKSSAFAQYFIVVQKFNLQRQAPFLPMLCCTLFFIGIQHFTN